jgi:hypothetical protein
VNFLDGKNQLQLLDVLKAAVVFVKCAASVRAEFLIAYNSVGPSGFITGPINVASDCFPLSN